VPIEAELKARVRDPDRIRDRLRQRADEEISVYRDAYYDHPAEMLTHGGRELRVRVIESDDGRRAVLTYKEPTVDEGSGSKPEYETDIADADTMRAILGLLGYTVLVSFAKHCRNYRFTSAGRDMLATLVTVPEIDGTFLEVETITTDDDLAPALDAVRAVLADLGIADHDLTTEQYTDAVAAGRHAGRARPAGRTSP
jgi:adenylate cyclase class 2